MMRIGRYIPGDTFLHRMRPSVKFVALIISFFLVLAADGPAPLAVVVLATASLVIFSGVDRRGAVAAAWGLRWFILLIFAFNALLFSDERPLLVLGPLHLTTAGVWQGARIAIRIELVTILGQLLMETTRPQGLVEGIRDLLRPLARIGVTVEVAALAVGVTLQFIPTLLRECNNLIKAQSIRLGWISSGRMLRRAKDFTHLLVPIFVAAFRRADELSRAMEARGYRIDAGDQGGHF